MGRQSGESIVSHSSSIALLQERFRQLQRVKEMREERELLKLFPETERTSSSSSSSSSSMQYDQPPRMFCHHDLSLSTEPSTFSYQPQSQTKQADYRTVKTPLMMNFWHTNRPVNRTSNSLDKNEVDTSLHL